MPDPGPGETGDSGRETAEYETLRAPAATASVDRSGDSPTVSGVAFRPGERVETGPGDLSVYWQDTTLDVVAARLDGVPVENASGETVGRVTEARFEPGDGLRYEAVLDDPADDHDDPTAALASGSVGLSVAWRAPLESTAGRQAGQCRFASLSLDPDAAPSETARRATETETVSTSIDAPAPETAPGPADARPSETSGKSMKSRPLRDDRDSPPDPETVETETAAIDPLDVERLGAAERELARVLSERSGAPERLFSWRDPADALDSFDALDAAEKERVLVAMGDPERARDGPTSELASARLARRRNDRRDRADDPGPDPAAALASGALLGREARDVARFDVSAAEYVSEVFDVDPSSFDASEDLAAVLRDLRETPDVERRRSRLRRRERERVHRLNGLAAEGRRDDPADDARLRRRERAPDDPDKLARAAIGGRDTAALASSDRDPAEYVERVYGIDVETFSDEYSLRAAIGRARDPRDTETARTRERRNTRRETDAALRDRLDADRETGGD